MANSSASISFTPPISDGGEVITSYTVTSTPDNITSSGASSPITVTGLTNGTPYTFTVHATNVNGDGMESADSNAVTPMCVLIPPLPSIFNNGVDFIELDCSEPVENCTEVPTGDVTFSVRSGVTALEFTATSLPYYAGGLTSDTTYFVAVRAEYVSGPGPYSDEIAVDTLQES